MFDEITYEDPKMILAKLIGEDGKGGLEKEILDGLNELKKLFNDIY